MNLLSLRKQVTMIDHVRRNGQIITEFHIGATILITRYEFMPNIITGVTRPTRYELLYVPVIDYNYSEYKTTIHIVDFDLAPVLMTFMAKLWEQSEVVMGD